MMTTKRTTLIVSASLLILILLTLVSYFSVTGDWTVIAGGQPVTGITGFGYAVGGTLFGLAVAFFALLFVGFILTGVSLFVMALFAAIFLAIVVLLSPLLLPLLIAGGLIMFFSRKKQVVGNQVS